MRACEFDWSPPPLPPQYVRLIEAFKESGVRSIHDLPYTPEFEALFAKLGYPDSAADRRAVWKLLVILQRSGLI